MCAARSRAKSCTLVDGADSNRGRQRPGQGQGQGRRCAPFLERGLWVLPVAAQQVSGERQPGQLRQAPQIMYHDQDRAKCSIRHRPWIVSQNFRTKVSHRCAETHITEHRSTAFRVRVCTWVTAPCSRHIYRVRAPCTVVCVTRCRHTPAESGAGASTIAPVSSRRGAATAVRACGMGSSNWSSLRVPA